VRAARAGASLLSVCVAAAVSVNAIAWGSSRSPNAHAAHVLNVRDEGHLRYVRSSGELIVDEGPIGGTLRGSTRVRFRYDGSPNVGARFVIYASGWSLGGYASGRLNNPASPNPSFRGALTLTSGSGRYAHAHGSGELFGVFNRRSYGLIVQAIGKLHY
jgi:hypothetical protein